MTGDELRRESAEHRRIGEWEASLQPGDRIEARWTNSFCYHRSPAVVVRVNRQSIRIRLTETMMAGTTLIYEAGREFPVPRFMGAGWSPNNRAAPPKEAP